MTKARPSLISLRYSRILYPTLAILVSTNFSSQIRASEDVPEPYGIKNSTTFYQLSPDSNNSSNFHKSNETSSVQTNQKQVQDELTKLELSTTVKDLASSAEDPIVLSDSRLVPRLVNPRQDPDFDTATEDDKHDDDDEPTYDGADSNLVQRKMVKDIAKVISKGMSGATDQMRLETLEDWRRKQRERKLVKDNRAKLFEDLLMTAIDSHGDAKSGTDSKSRKEEGVKKRTRQLNSGKPSLDESSTDSLDPDLSTDAETVLQHLSGLASIVDGQSPFKSPLTSEGLTLGEPTSFDGDQDQTILQAHKLEGLTSSSDRPIIKRFKKIKRQFSQRRKQLDHLRKLFNSDLGLNQRDTSRLVIANHSHNKAIRDAFSDMTIIDDSTGQSKRKSPNSKMHDLMNYLKENPDTLISAVADLSGEHEPSRSATSMSSFDEDSSLLLENSNSRRRRHRARDVDQDRASLGYHSRRNSSRDSSTGTQDYRQKVRNVSSLETFYTPPKQHLNSRSAETLLLDSLRERQLLNLAKLDMVLADRLQASNKSLLYSSTNSSYPAQRGLDKNQSVVPPDNQMRLPRPSNHSYSNKSFIRSDGELLHHFMVVAPNGDSSGRPGLGYDHNLRDGSNSDSTLRQNFHQSRQNQYRQPSLSRFQDWTDVSQSEASQARRDDYSLTGPNITWTPYDLSIGGTSTGASTSIIQRGRGERQIQSKQHENSFVVADPPRSASDLSITRAGESKEGSYQMGRDVLSRNSPSSKSMFMARSSQTRSGGAKQHGSITPVDYFSAYKSRQESHESGEQVENKPMRRDSKTISEDIVEDGFDNDETGAIWAS